MKFIKISIALLLLIAIAVNIASCSVKVNAADLMDGIKSKSVTGKSTDNAFISSMADFSVELFKKTVTDKQNSLVSPLSVMLALSMTANGADGETLSQMETLLGGGISLNDLNEYLYSYVKGLPSEAKSKLNIANSIWFRDNEDRLQVKADFLQKNANYYNASAYKSAFDSNTLKDINNWVKTNTDGMIDKILDKISDDAVMYLINAVVFDAEWKTVYNKENIQKSDFTNIKGEKQNVDFMYSNEYIYLDNGKATGFIKPYVNDKYSFAALLPNENISVEEYIQSLTGTGFIDTIKNAESCTVNASMPKFKYDYEIQMNDALISLGMPDAFDSGKADFKKMATSSNGNIYIGKVLHKTFISVDELGTKAGAVTMVAMAEGSAMPQEVKIVNLNRPFVYAIIDNATNLPVFIGTVTDVK